MLTGAQIRDARSRRMVRPAAGEEGACSRATVTRAERSSGEAAITLDQERKIRAALQVAGI